LARNLESPTQSKKLIAVWTEIEPIPLVVNTPVPIIIGIILLGIVHAYLFGWLSAAWPKGFVNRGIRFTGLVFVMTFLF